MISHVWPGITALNVWDLDLQSWCVMAQAADQWLADRADAGSASSRRKRRVR